MATTTTGRAIGEKVLFRTYLGSPALYKGKIVAIKEFRTGVLKERMRYEYAVESLHEQLTYQYTRDGRTDYTKKPKTTSYTTIQVVKEENIF